MRRFGCIALLSADRFRDVYANVRVHLIVSDTVRSADELREYRDDSKLIQSWERHLNDPDSEAYRQRHQINASSLATKIANLQTSGVSMLRCVTSFRDKMTAREICVM